MSLNDKINNPILPYFLISSECGEGFLASFMLNQPDINSLFNKLCSVNFLCLQKKFILKVFFQYINQGDFVYHIILKSLLGFIYNNNPSLDLLKDILVYNYKNYLFINNISVKFTKNDKNTKLKLSDLEKACAILVEILIKNNIIENITGKLINININISDAIIYTKRWPLTFLPKNYIFDGFNYKGGYYSKYQQLKLYLPNYKIPSEINISQEGLANIHKLQSTPFTLIQNSNIISYIKQLEQKLRNMLNTNTKYISEWFACYQYLNYIENNIFQIYYPFVLNFRGRIMNGLNFGLIPSTGLLSFGKVILDNNNLLNVQKHLSCLFNLNIEDFYLLTEININIDNIEEFLINYSFHHLIVLLDYKFNVLQFNVTETFIQLDSVTSLFLCIAMISGNNDIIKEVVSTSNIYNIILNNLKCRSFSKLISYKFIKKIYSIIAFGNFIQTKILDELMEKYDVKFFIDNNFFKMTEKILSEEKLFTNKKLKFFKTLITDIKMEILKHYPKLLIYLKFLKKVKFRKIDTRYFKYKLTCLKMDIKTFKLRKNLYTKTWIRYPHKSSNLYAKPSIANICHSLGDALLIHNVLEDTLCNFYPDIDIFFCNVQDFQYFQQIISSKYLYLISIAKYYKFLKYKEFNFKKD